MKNLFFTAVFVFASLVIFSQSHSTEIQKTIATFKSIDDVNLVFVDDQNIEKEFYKNGSTLSDIKLFIFDANNKLVINPDYNGKKFDITYKWIDAKVRAGDENSDLITKKVKVISKLELIQ